MGAVDLKQSPAKHNRNQAIFSEHVLFLSRPILVLNYS